MRRGAEAGTVGEGQSARGIVGEAATLRGAAEAAIEPGSKCCRARSSRGRVNSPSKSPKSARSSAAERCFVRVPRRAPPGLQALSSDAKASLASAAADHASDVVTAAPLRKDEMEHVRDTLNAALGLELSFRFRVDPALIAGVELRSPDTIVRNSWRADLDRIRKELDGDGHPNDLDLWLRDARKRVSATTFAPSTEQVGRVKAWPTALRECPACPMFGLTKLYVSNAVRSASR